MRRLLAFPAYWRSIKAAEVGRYPEALANYELYRIRVGSERPSDRAMHAKLLILCREYDAASVKLRDLIEDLELGPRVKESGLTSYVLAYSKLRLAGLMGDPQRAQYLELAKSHQPPGWLGKVLPIGNDEE